MSHEGGKGIPSPTLQSRSVQVLFGLRQRLLLYRHVQEARGRLPAARLSVADRKVFA